MAQVPVISIIDDDASIRGALQRFLRALGYLAHAFASAEDFLRSPQVADNSCLILDVRMPEMSGLELQKQLQIQGTQVPIIFITSVQDQSIRTQALNAGAVCVLTKPFEIRTLIKHLEDALKKSLPQRRFKLLHSESEQGRWRVPCASIDLLPN